MKKFLLSGFLTTIVFSMFAQTQIGKTFYDLQTNNAVCRRVAINPAGELVATYTRSHQTATTFTDRGTGYNYSADGGATWDETTFLGTFSRADSFRTGWPNIVYTASKEVVMSHVADATNTVGGVHIMRRDLGDVTGTWEKHVIVDTDYDPTWVRSASNGDSIVAIYSFLDADMSGMNGGLRMVTSADGGDTWNGPMDVPLVNSSNYLNVNADSYSIDMNSNGKIVIALGAYQVEVITSDDFGATFTNTPVVEMYDIDGNLTPLFNSLAGESLAAVDGADATFSVVIDDNDLVHLWFGKINLSKDDINTTTVTYLPLDVAIMYWNSNMSAAKTIHESRLAAQQVGLPNPLYTNTVFSGTAGFGTQIELYNQQLISTPSGGYDTNGNIFMAYSAMRPAMFDDITDLTSTNNVDAGGFHFRDVYFMKSSDNGVTWDGPLNLSDQPMREAVYPGVPRKVFGTDVPVIWQEDAVPGVSLQNPTGGPATSPVENQIMFINVDVASVVSPTDITAPTIFELETGINAVDAFIGCDVDFASIFDNDDVPTGPGVLDFQLVDASLLNTPGVQTVEVYILDAAGNSSDTIVAIVTVADDSEAPIVDLVGPASIDVLLNTSFTDPGITYSDNACDPTLAPTFVSSVDTNAIGIYVVTWTVTDNNGNSTDISRTVNVIATDDVDPVITLMGSTFETVEACSSWTEAGYTAFDNIDYDVTANVSSTGTVDINTPGTYTITYSVTDFAGNTGNIDRVVTVEDNTAPNNKYINGRYSIVHL